MHAIPCFQMHYWIVRASSLQELVKKLDTKELRLSKEPLLSDEVITIVVRMPDGGRCERRFLKTDKLEVKLILEYDEN